MDVEVRGSQDFMNTYNRLRDMNLKQKLDDVMNSLKTENNNGDKIARKLFPRSYEINYAITNLFRYRIGEHRLLYTISIQFNKKIYLLLDFLNHSDYDELFGYNTS
jgi:mRNA-degrading endonuclease RelE of RelBE toxin-antitoxin system